MFLWMLKLGVSDDEVVGVGEGQKAQTIVIHYTMSKTAHRAFPPSPIGACVGVEVSSQYDQFGLRD